MSRKRKQHNKFRAENVVPINDHPLVGFSVGVPEVLDKAITYAIGQDGLYAVRQNNILTSITQIAKVEQAPCIKSGVTIKVPKLPGATLGSVVKFFREVYNTRKTEALVQIFFDGTGYHVYVPEQDVSAGSAKPTSQHEHSNNMLLTHEIHSHGSMGGFFSHGDCADEGTRGLRMYGVIGKVDNIVPEMKWRASIGGGFVDLSINDVVDCDAFTRPYTMDLDGASILSGQTITVMVTSDPFEMMTFPEEWLSKVRERITACESYRSFHHMLPAYYRSDSKINGALVERNGALWERVRSGVLKWVRNVEYKPSMFGETHDCGQWGD